jgi:hypothetical protein
MEFPSTKAAITCARRVVLSWFIAVSCLYNSSITANVKLFIASIMPVFVLESLEAEHD